MKKKYTKKEKKVLHNWVDNLTDEQILLFLTSSLALFIYLQKSFKKLK